MHQYGNFTKNFYSLCPIHANKLTSFLPLLNGFSRIFDERFLPTKRFSILNFLLVPVYQVGRTNFRPGCLTTKNSKWRLHSQEERLLTDIFLVIFWQVSIIFFSWSLKMINNMLCRGVLLSF